MGKAEYDSSQVENTGSVEVVVQGDCSLGDWREERIRLADDTSNTHRIALLLQNKVLNDFRVHNQRHHSRNAFVKVFRNNEQVYKGKISSLKRVKEDVKEVNKGLECGIVIDGFQTIKIDDILEIFDINYLSQEL